MAASEGVMVERVAVLVGRKGTGSSIKDRYKIYLEKKKVSLLLRPHTTFVRGGRPFPIRARYYID